MADRTLEKLDGSGHHEGAELWRACLPVELRESAEPLDTKTLEPGTFTPGRRFVCPETRRPISRVVLTIAHIHDEDPQNVDESNLEALSQYCHNKLDAPRRAERRRR